MVLSYYYSNDLNINEIGVDEVGRGPMFGRVYSAAVILPKNDSFKHELMKDSKQFSSVKKLKETAEYIKKNAIAYSIAYEDEISIDKNNIKNATHIAMHKAIKNIIDINQKYIILVDGNDFKPITYFDISNNMIKEHGSVCIIGGDNKYTAIAAASILAKVERDLYIEEMCIKYPKLNDLYDLLKNKGYGTKKHIQGIKENGITQWHRKTFGICKTSNLILID